MEQQKVGNVLRELRKEKNITQEQLAEAMNVSRRTVSRWETGSNMPDLDVLMEIADYYEVDLRALLDGERKAARMDEEFKETVLGVADYCNEGAAKVTRRIHGLFIVGCVAFSTYFMMSLTAPEEPGAIYGFLQGFSGGVSFGMLIVGTIMTSKHAQKLRAFKERALKRTAAQ